MARSRLVVAAVVAMATVLPVRALGPHEIALLVHANSPESREVANHYIRIRSVPSQNVVYLDLPTDFGGSNAIVSLADFRQTILAPVTNALRERRLDDHTLAWVYSAGFPVAVQADSVLSIHAVTFLRGQAPTAAQANEGRPASPLFRGPSSVGGPQGDALSLEQFAMALRTNMPVPAMTLGHVAPRGLPVREIVDGLRSTARSDGVQPEGAVNFVVSQDVRSTCRAWQIPGTVAELAALGVKTAITTNQPDRTKPLMGLQVGAADIEAMLDVKLQPGSMAEHLTSYGADFSHGGQSKITQWLHAGAGGSAGTVVEPLSLWPKFPHARFHAHYARGCTMLESFYLSLASPVQTFLLGDPLARPYAKLRPLTLICMADDDTAISGPAEFIATENIGAQARNLTFLYLIDGRAVMTDGSKARVTIDTRTLSDGWHELRAVGYSSGSIREQCFARKLFAVNNQGQRVTVVSPKAGSTVISGTPAGIKVEASGTPTGYDLLAQGHLLASSTNAELTVDFGRIGPGPITMQVIARYEGNQSVSSRPLPLEVKSSAQ